MSGQNFSFLHAADLHLDTPFQGLARVRPELAEVLRDASLKAFDRLVELALRERVAFILLAGDLYDGPRRGVRAQLRFARGVQRLAEQGIRTFIVHGNHDPLGGWNAVRSWPPEVKIFPSGRVEDARVTRNGTVLATVYGISYEKPEVRKNLARLFRRRESPGIHIGLLHCNVGSNSEHAPYSPCELEDLKRASMDYWALGHVHRRSILCSDSPWVVYPGNLQGRSPKPSEQGAKGAVLVRVAGGRIRNVEPVALDLVRFVTLKLDIRGIRDLPSLGGRLRREGEALLARSEGRSLIVRVLLCGRGELVRDLRCDGALEGLLQELRAESTVEEPFLWWQDLVDDTKAVFDLEALRNRGDFSADLIKLAEELAGDLSRWEKFKESYLGNLPSLELKRTLGVNPLEALQPGTSGHLEEARDHALHLLEEGESEQ